MKSIKTLTATILGLVAVLSPLEVLARSNHEHHISLVRVALDTGINFRINPPKCDEEQAMGWYWASRNELVVCQQNKVRGLSMEVDWTEEDYDTLRHEIHHLVQDCMSRDNRDGHLGAVYQDPAGLGKEILGSPTMRQIAEAYGDKDDHHIMMEIEAFSVARMNDPLEQVKDIQTYCM